MKIDSLCQRVSSASKAITSNIYLFVAIRAKLKQGRKHLAEKPDPLITEKLEKKFEQL